MEEDNEERLLIRDKVANLSFEELAKLKAEIGGQAYNEAVFGVQKTPCIEKRLNKNRPTEISSKVRPRTCGRFASSGPVARDPRFDHLCGDYNAQEFKKNYSFVDEIKLNEKEKLKKALKKEKNERKKDDISFLITRMENQEREEKRLNKIQEKKKKVVEERIQMLREGKKPYFQKKSEKRLLDMVDQYETLKKKGKLNKAIQKYRQKTKKRDIKNMPSA